MDVELIIGLAFIIMLAVLFLAFGLNARTLKTTDKVFKVFFLVSSGVLWFVLAVIFPAVEQTYTFIGWAFLIPAVFCWIMGSVSIFEVYKHATMEDWQKEDSAEAP